MGKKTTIKWLAIGGVILGVGLMFGTAWATNMFGPSNSCTGLNCGARIIEGSVTAFGPTAQPWVAEIFSPPGRCFRLAVTAQGTDLEMVVRAPNGAVYRNDDGGEGCFFCPIVKIANTPNNGWYTVSIAHFLGSPVSANFTMLYSTYPIGNPNCAAATVPVNSLEPNTKSHKSPDMGPQQHQEGTPGAP